MKKIKLLLTTAALLFSFIACDELSDLMQITFENVEIEEVMDIPLTDFSARTLSLITSSNDTTYFSDTTEISLAIAEEEADTTIGEEEKDELVDYLNKLSSVEIDTLTLELLENHNNTPLPENFKIVELNFTISNSSDSILLSENHTNITPGMKLISNNNAENFQAVGKVLEDNGTLVIRSSGTVIGSEGIDGFALKTRIIADIKAGL